MLIERNTIQCALVLEAVAMLKNHATADEVYESVAAQHPSISRGTVYRNLNKLAESGKIFKVEMPDGADRFDHQCFPHYHARCVKCGKVFDVDMEYINNLEKNIKDAHGFEFLGYTLVFNGICSDCKEQRLTH